MPEAATDVPPAYLQYTMERAFWRELGWSAEYLKTRPRKQVHDYLTIMRLIASERQSNLRKQQAAPGSH